MKAAIKKVGAAFESGYDWPLDWNAACRVKGWHTSLIDVPPEPERWKRAVLWTWAALLEVLSDTLHPDGPRIHVR